jgi:hypothetical protein
MGLEGKFGDWEKRNGIAMAFLRIMKIYCTWDAIVCGFCYGKVFDRQTFHFRSER